MTHQPSESDSRPDDGSRKIDAAAPRPAGKPWNLVGRDQLALYGALLLLLVAIIVRQYSGRGRGEVRTLERGGSVAYCVDLNGASLAELDLLPGIGPSKAEAIIGYREANGEFRSVEELSQVRGISRTLAEELRPLVAVEKTTRSGAERE
jgi:competence protein ComEA